MMHRFAYNDIKAHLHIISYKGRRWGSFNIQYCLFDKLVHYYTSHLSIMFVVINKKTFRTLFAYFIRISYCN